MLFSMYVSTTTWSYVFDYGPFSDSSIIQSVFRNYVVFAVWYEKQNCLFKVLPYATKPQKRSKRRPISVLPLRFGNSTRIINMQVIQTRIPVDLDEDKEKGDEMEPCRKTNFTLPGKITNDTKGGTSGKTKHYWYLMYTVFWNIVG